MYIVKFHQQGNMPKKYDTRIGAESDAATLLRTGEHGEIAYVLKRTKDEQKVITRLRLDDGNYVRVLCYDDVRYV